MTSVLYTGIVKQVISGDSILIRDRPLDGPPPERIITLSNISCGRLARRPSPAIPSGVTEDPFAWIAREYARAKLIGKEVCYTVETELPSGRKYGYVYIGKNTSAENIAISLVEQGLAEVRKLNNPTLEKNTGYQQLLAAEETAKVNGMGRWSSIPVGATRDVIWSIENPKEFIDKYKGIPIPAVVEYVRDGTSFQLTIVPDTVEGQIPTVFYHISLSISGIKAPVFKLEDGKSIPEPFALDAQFFVESRLLHRDVNVLLESVTPQGFIGSVLHPKGNIAEILLREGLAKCIDWNLGFITIPGASEAYRNAERSAKERQIRLWKGYQPPAKPMSPSLDAHVYDPNRIEQGMSFTGQITEVGNGDNISVRCLDGTVRKFFLASIRAPRPVPKEGEDQTQRGRIRPLYDVPYVFESREVLRAYVGKPVTVSVDYIQPKTVTIADERPCATIKYDAVNLAELLVSKGLAQVIRYRGANDARSLAYTDLLTAEEQAQAAGLGIHSKSDPPVHRVADLTGNVAKSRQFLHFFQRTPRISAVVEFVVHGSRVRAYLPRETCIITLLLSGVQCPRRGRAKPDGTTEPDTPFSAEACEFTKQLCHQRDVEVEILTIDRVGNFVGYIFADAGQLADGNQKGNATTATTNTTLGVGKQKKKKKATDTSSTTPVSLCKCNLSVLLVSKGLATVNRTATIEQSPYYHDLARAEETAKEARVGLWSSDVFVKQWEEELSAANETSYQNGLDDERGMGIGGIAEYVDDISDLTLNDQNRPTTTSVDGKPSGVPAIQWRVVQITAMPKPVAGSQSLRFFAQHVVDSATIVKISELLNHTPPVLLPNFQPKKGDLCAACFSLDNCWYRARILRRSAKAVVVIFIDFGNEETIESNDAHVRLAPLPTACSLASLSPQAHEYRLAFVQMPSDSGDRLVAERAFAECVENKEVRISVQYDSIPCANEPLKPVPAVAMTTVPLSSAVGGSSGHIVEPLDVACTLLNEGLVCVEPMQTQLIKCLPTPGLLQSCLVAQASAKKERKNLWCYGDFRIDHSQV